MEFSDDPSDILIHGEQLQPVILSGYTRDFSHVMSNDLMPEYWRFDTTMEMLQSDSPRTENHGTLNIQEEREEDINAILVPMTEEEIDFYDTMELGYHLEDISPEKLDTNPSKPIKAALSHNTGNAEPVKGYVEDYPKSWNDWSEVLRGTRRSRETFKTVW